jgi:hypothetical protein
MEVVVTGDPSGATGAAFSFIYYPRHNYIT